MYRLVGPIQHAKNMPAWFEEKFINGFPSFWKSNVDDYLEWLHQQNSDDDSDGNMCVDSNGKSNSFKRIIVSAGHLFSP